MTTRPTPLDYLPSSLLPLTAISVAEGKGHDILCYFMPSEAGISAFDRLRAVEGPVGVHGVSTCIEALSDAALL